MHNNSLSEDTGYQQHRRRNTGRNKPESFHIVVQIKKRTHKNASQPPELKRWFENVWRERRPVFAGQRTKEGNVDQRSLKVWTELRSVKSGLWVRSTHARWKNRITRRHGREQYLIPSQSLVSWMSGPICQIWKCQYKLRKSLLQKFGMNSSKQWQ